MSKSSFGKPLKGVSSLSASFTAQVQDSILGSLSSGGLSFNNITIDGGVINNTTIGQDGQGPGYFTTIQSGDNTGKGYSVCFFGQTVGDSACWMPVSGTWNIQGDLITRDISDLGNLRLAVNTLSSTNTNGNVIIDPNGSGSLVVSGAMSQSTTTGNITFNTTGGLYSLNTSKTITTTSQNKTSIITKSGDISLDTGTNVSNLTISFISTGTTPTITTTTTHNLEVGDTLQISGTNSTPNIDGVYTVTDVPTTTTFKIIPGFNVTNIGTIGSITQENSIYLNATDYVKIPENIPLTFGSTTDKYIENSSSDLNIVSDTDINLTPTGSVVIPDTIPINFGPSTRTIKSDSGNLDITNTGADIVLNCSETIINGDLTVNGTTTTVSSTTVTVQDPVFTLGGSTPPVTDDNKDRGIEFRWHNGSNSKIGFFGRNDLTGCFTYIPEATNTNEVFTGTPGCATFGQLNATSMNLQNGSISNISSVNTCNINCTGDLSITGSLSTTITTPTLNLNSTTTNVNSSNFTTNSLIPVIANSSNTVADSFDRGFLYNYYSSSSKQGFFGFDSSSNCFTFIPDATVTAGIVSGAIGNMCIGTANGTNASFTVGNFGSINTCTINCSGTMNINATTAMNLNSTTVTATGNLISSGNFTVNGGTTIINSTDLSIQDPVITIGGVTPPISNDSVDRGIQFRWHDGSSAKTGFFGRSASTGCFTYIPDATNTNDVFTGTVGCAKFGNTTVNDLTVTGTLNYSGLTSGSLSTEHLSTSGGGNINPSGSVNISFITVTSSGNATGTLQSPSVDGYAKHIIISSLAANAEYHLTAPAGLLLDPGTGTTVTKTMIFDRPGQSIFIIWDNNLGAYIPAFGGVC